MRGAMRDMGFIIIEKYTEIGLLSPNSEHQKRARIIKIFGSSSRLHVKKSSVVVSIEHQFLPNENFFHSRYTTHNKKPEKPLSSWNANKDTTSHCGEK